MSNFGFIFFGDEESNGTTAKIGTKEQAAPLNRPQLKIEYDVITSIEDLTTLPDDFFLRQNYPNPFNPATTIEYRLASAGNIQLEIFNSIGQKVRLLEKGFRSSGQHQVIWDGKNNLGQAVPSGTYFYRLKTGQGHQIRKMLLLK